MSLKLQIEPPILTTKWFEQELGGKWKYDSRSGYWNCDDGDRYITRVLTGTDREGEYTGETSLCMYSRSNKHPSKWIT